MFVLWVFEEFVWCVYFDDLFVIYKDYLVCYLMGKVYFVGYVKYGYVFIGEVYYGVEYFFDYFGIEC